MQSGFVEEMRAVICLSVSDQYYACCYKVVFSFECESMWEFVINSGKMTFCGNFENWVAVCEKIRWVRELT